MRFQIPQFIEVEDKIFGPLTLKQFIYIAGGIGMSIVLFLVIPWWYVAAIPIALVMGISAALAFYKINNKPFIFVVEAAIKYFFNSKLYVWKKEEPEIKTPDEMTRDSDEEEASPLGFIPHLTNSKLKDMTWDLSTKRDSVNPITRGESQTNT